MRPGTAGRPAGVASRVAAGGTGRADGSGVPPADALPINALPINALPVDPPSVDAPPRLEGLAPVIGRATRLVVLGSFPGVVSLKAGQYYAHPRNHFWPILAALWGVDLPALPYPARLAELRRRGLGLWDVYRACRREGSLDSAIEAAEPNDLASLRRRAPGLCAVAHNGGESARSMAVTRALGVPVWRLPSTSPANASWSFERKRDAWREAFRAAGIDAD